MGIVSTDDEEEATLITPSNVSEALSALGERSGVSFSEMAQLEFPFVEALDQTLNLDRQIAESPSFFVQLLAHIFRRRDDGQDPAAWHIEDENRAKAIASAAYRLLQRASRVPGTGADGSINADSLLHWLKEARRLCADVGREVIGDLHIGELLSKAPSNEDGAWPCEAVCQALEAVASQEIARGFAIGKRNAHGVFIRSGEGGNDERKLAAQYRSWAQRRRFDYPFASSAINLIAEWYDSDAKRVDTRAKLTKRLNTWG